MIDKCKVPEIRFKGFSGEWEGSEFSGLVSRITSMCDHLELPRIEYEDIVSGSGILNKDVFKKKRIKRGVEFDEGDILFGKLRPYLNNLLWPHFKGIAVGDFWVLRANKTDAAFVYSFIQNSKFQYVANLSAGSKMPRSDWSIVSLSKFLIPASIKEQSQIGTFFQNLDSLITHHQRKYDKLSTVKKAMLQKMFPKDGADVPEIRFKGFTEKWKRRTLGEVIEISSAARVHKNEWTQTGVPFFRSSDVVAAYKGDANSKAFISIELYQELTKLIGSVQRNDVLVTGGGSIGIPYLVESNEPLYFKDADLLWFKKSENISGRFLYTFLTTTVFRGYVQSITHIGTISHYTIEQAKSTPIKLPNLYEQNKIEEFFQNLDSLITLQQRELDKLKNIKKACLEKMFV